MHKPFATACLTMMLACLAMMFAEGPGNGPEHGHYVNMTDRQVRGVACGVSRGANGEVWMIHDFFR